MGYKIRRRKSMSGNVITPSEFEARKAVSQLQNNPMFSLIAGLNAGLEEVAQRLMILSVHFNSLMDYMNHHNMLSLEPAYLDFAEGHSAIAGFLPEQRKAFVEGRTTIWDLIENVRGFNADPGQVVKIRGDMFGLDEWLSKNPDNLSPATLDALAAEFGLGRAEETEEKDVAEVSEATEN